MNNQVIPAEAVAAAAKALYFYLDEDHRGAPPSWESLAEDDDAKIDAKEAAHIALEAAAPYLMASVIKLADEWEQQGEEYMADSKTFGLDESVSIEFLKEGATMVENARHIRNAIAGADAV